MAAGTQRSSSAFLLNECHPEIPHRLQPLVCEWEERWIGHGWECIQEERWIGHSVAQVSEILIAVDVEYDEQKDHQYHPSPNPSQSLSQTSLGGKEHSDHPLHQTSYQHQSPSARP
jgi:hypothetical protein